MGFEIQPAENYNLIEIGPAFNELDYEDLVNELNDGLLDTPYLIVQSHLQDTLTQEVYVLFEELNALVVSKNGLMLFIDFDEAEVINFESLSLTHIPSFDEAVDYIFMDQLEKELGEE